MNAHPEGGTGETVMIERVPIWFDEWLDKEMEKILAKRKKKFFLFQ